MALTCADHRGTRQRSNVYFTILAAIAGFIFTAKLHPEEQRVLIVVSLIVSGFFAIIMASVGYGVLKGIAHMEAVLFEYHPAKFTALSMPAYFARGKTVGIVVAICCGLILATIAGALVVKS